MHVHGIVNGDINLVIYHMIIIIQGTGSEILQNFV